MYYYNKIKKQNLFMNRHFLESLKQIILKTMNSIRYVLLLRDVSVYVVRPVTKYVLLP